MKQLTTTLFAAAALTLVAQAGSSAPAMSSGKGKVSVPPPPAGCACDIAYNYVQAFYGHGEFDNGSSDGFNVQLSYSPVEHFFLTAGGGWSDVSEDNFGSYNDTYLHAGAGGWIALAPCVHLGLEAGAAYSATDAGGADFNDGEWAAYVKPHVRFCAGILEGKVGVEFTSADVDTQWMLQTEFILKVLGPADLAFGVDFNDDAQYYNAGVRFRF